MLRTCSHHSILPRKALLLALQCHAGSPPPVSSHKGRSLDPQLCSKPRYSARLSTNAHTVLAQAAATQSTDSDSQSLRSPPGQPPAHVPQKPVRRLALVDAFAIFFRVHHAYGTVLKSERGESTSILYGFMKVIITLMEFTPPITHLAIVMDFSGKNFRHELFKEYKAHRPPMPEEIKAAIPQVEEMLATMNIPVLRVPGVEADDVIGCLATRALQENFGVAIVSPDKDFFQLLQRNLMILKAPKKNAVKEELRGGYQVYTEAHFKREFDLEPSQWVDALALIGDTADNVPGVDGIGMKGATALLQQFGSLEAMLDRPDEIKKPSHRKVLGSEEGRAVARLCKELVTLQTNFSVPQVQQPFSRFVRQQYSEKEKDEILAKLKGFSFHKFAARLKSLWSEPQISML